MLDNFVAPYDATVVEKLRPRAWCCSARRTWTSSRWARRTRRASTAREEPVGPARCPAARRAAPRRPWRRASRRSPPAPTPAARSASPPRCRHHRHQADLRARLALRHDRVRVEPRPGGHLRARPRTRVPAARRWRASTRATRPASTRRCRTTRGELGRRCGPAHRLPEGVLRRRARGRDRRARAAALDEYRALGARSSRSACPSLPLSVPTYYVVAPAEARRTSSRFDGVRFGHRCEDPKDLRSPSTSARAARASAPRSSAGS
jgi:Asp-tRNA(Asn)/Glu-tRNA(Gln) amidotransferase A subunit family amidase